MKSNKNNIISLVDFIFKYNNWLDDNNYLGEELPECDYNTLKEYAFNNYKYQLSKKDYQFLIDTIAGAFRKGTGNNDADIENQNFCAVAYYPMNSVLNNVDENLFIVKLIKKYLNSDLDILNPNELLEDDFLNSMINEIRNQDNQLNDEQIKKIIEEEFGKLYQNIYALSTEQVNHRKQIMKRAELTFKDRIDRILEELMF